MYYILWEVNMHRELAKMTSLFIPKDVNIILDDKNFQNSRC